jgi:hypothetical protein
VALDLQEMPEAFGMALAGSMAAGCVVIDLVGLGDTPTDRRWPAQQAKAWSRCKPLHGRA